MNGRNNLLQQASVPQFLLDDTKKVIDSLLIPDAKDIDNNIQMSVKEVASDYVEGLVNDILDCTAAELRAKPAIDLEPEQLLTQLGQTLQQQASIKLEELQTTEGSGLKPADNERLNSADLLESSLMTAFNDVYSKLAAISGK